MTTQQTITKLAKELDINKIYAQHVFHNADKTRLLEDATRIVSIVSHKRILFIGLMPEHNDIYDELQQVGFIT